MTDREAMKMALAKLEHLWEIGIDAEYKVELLPEIEILRQAIEQAEYDKLTAKFGERAKEYLVAAKKSWQPEQEPVTWAETNDLVCALLRQAHDVLTTASYPMRRPWVGLTDETLDDVYFCVEGGTTPLETWREQARAIEAKLKEKNT